MAARTCWVVQKDRYLLTQKQGQMILINRNLQAIIPFYFSIFTGDPNSLTILNKQEPQVSRVTNLNIGDVVLIINALV